MSYSEAAERNKKPILDQLKQYLKSDDKVIEIGSGTGQHACCFTQSIPGLVWQCSDLKDNLSSLKQVISQQNSEQLLMPIECDVRSYQWDQKQYDAVYSANALHIMSWDAAQVFLSNVNHALKSRGLLILYGPYAYANQPLCKSNQNFDRFLKERDPKSGIRSFDEVKALSEKAGFVCEHDIEMPANNRLIIWSKMF
jgi:cyclopropane fatty-acyl-phospholipid synthase-like methyltransferase